MAVLGLIRIDRFQGDFVRSARKILEQIGSRTQPRVRSLSKDEYVRSSSGVQMVGAETRRLA